MTPLRKKRLMLLASEPFRAHQKYYSQYCELIGCGLVMWAMGTAFLTNKGYEWLKDNA